MDFEEPRKEGGQPVDELSPDCASREEVLEALEKARAAMVVAS